MNKIEGLQGKRIIQHVVVTLLILQTIFIENFVACQRRSSNQRSDVYIAGFFPFADGVENSQTGRGVMPSVKLALSHVNENSKILSNYRLHMWWNDTECNAAVGVKSFFDMMHTGPNKLMLFGAACTHVTDPIAKASKHWHLTQLSYADTHPMFTKDAFPNFFRVVPSENAFNTPRLALLKEFNWTRVGTLYQNEPRYSLPHNHMVADLDTIGCEVVETQSFVNDVNESLKKLREKDVRIILGNFNEHFARKVFCEAFKLDMYGRSYQYLIMATYSSNWWNTTGVRYEGDIDCTEEEILTALECAILVDLLPLSTSGDITISGLTADEYLEEYNSMRGSEYSRFHGYTYDGIWAAALAIEYVAGKKQNALDMFNYRDNGWEQVFLEALRNTSFEGVTGPVRFYNNERKANILITQFQQGKEEKIGEYHAQPNRLDLTLGNAVKWFGRAPPKDRTMIIIEHSQVDLTIYIISASFSVIGIILALVFLGFNIKYRNQRYIKMSSPHLNNLIIFGCIMTYASIIFLGLDTTLSSIAAFPYICTARAWLLMAGFSLAFGAMFSKTWRVHSIFTDLKLNKKVIKDYQLFMVVGILLSIDIALITTWQVADPFFRDTKQLEPRHHEYLEDVWVIVENEYCQSEHITVFVGIIYAYKGLLLVFGAFLAWETRHVSIPALNDSKHIGFSVYNVFITCLFGAAISLVLSDRKDLVFILLSFFIVFCTTATLCLVFVPKVRLVLLELKRNPQGVVDKRVRATLRPMSKRRDSSVCELEQRMRDVRNTNSRFRKALMEKEAELNALIQKIGPEAKKWIEGVSCTGTAKEPLISNDTLARLAPIVSRELPSATEITEMTSVDSTTSAFAEHFTTSVISTTAPSQQPIKMPIEQSPPTVINASISPYNIPTSTALHNMLKQQNQPDPFTSSSKVESESRKHHKPIEKRNSVSAHSQTDLSLTSKCTDINNTTNHLQERARRQSSVAVGETRGNNNQTSISRTTSASSQRKDSEYSSNTDLNSISCPHTKSNNVRTPSESRRVSMGSSLKSNFVVSQSDLWDTNTLSHTKQHTRQSPRNYQTQTRCTEHSHIIAPYEMSGTSPIQRSVSEKNRNKHRHKPPKGTVCQSETDSEREKDLTPPTTQCMQTRKLSKSTIQQSAHHHSTPNVAPLDKQTYTNSHLQATQHQKQRRHRNKTDTSIYGAYGSESELIEGNGGAGGGNVSSLAGDTSILPIFHKLLTEKQPQYRSRSAVGQSCPNISIKCDIVEYL